MYGFVGYIEASSDTVHSVTQLIGGSSAQDENSTMLPYEVSSVSLTEMLTEYTGSTSEGLCAMSIYVVTAGEENGSNEARLE